MHKVPVRSRTRTLVDSHVPTPPNFDPKSLRLCIEYRALGDLKEPTRKLRAHGQRSRKALAAAISNQGFLVPMLVDTEGRIIAGYGRWLAAKDIGLEKVPVIEASHLTPEQRRIFAIADNKLPEINDWNFDELRVELADLSELSLTTDLNIELTGFTTAEIDLQLSIKPEPQGDGESSKEDELPDLEKVAITRAGDVWQLGSHRLICGSSLEAQTFEVLLTDERAQMVFGDPPYNLAAASYSGLGKHKARDFEQGAGEMSQEEFTSFLRTAFTHCAAYSVDGSISFQCMDWRHMREMLDAGHAAYTELKNLVVWKKHSAGMGSFYRSHYELIFVWKSGTEPHINNFGLGETGRFRTNCWEYRGNAGFHKERDEELAAHATVKPWSMVADAIRDCSKRGGTILDPFGGSGTTLIAAEKTRRKARLIELDPLYCDVTIRRWQKLTGKDAVLVASGETFSEIEERVLDDLDDPGDEQHDSVIDAPSCDEEDA